ncbi:hypothetical protein BDZ89DRAFT_1052993 [Hymenopellis radicata]|nr:hypothetical protein BDZ89DRAFT_1052993 [Hymenopellis radicata]
MLVLSARWTTGLLRLRKVGVKQRLAALHLTSGLYESESRRMDTTGGSVATGNLYAYCHARCLTDRLDESEDRRIDAVLLEVDSDAIVIGLTTAHTSDILVAGTPHTATAHRALRLQPGLERERHGTLRRLLGGGVVLFAMNIYDHRFYSTSPANISSLCPSPSPLCGTRLTTKSAMRRLTRITASFGNGNGNDEHGDDVRQHVQQASPLAVSCTSLIADTSKDYYDKRDENEDRNAYNKDGLPRMRDEDRDASNMMVQQARFFCNFSNARKGWLREYLPTRLRLAFGVGVIVVVVTSGKHKIGLSGLSGLAKDRKDPKDTNDSQVQRHKAKWEKEDVREKLKSTRPVHRGIGSVYKSIREQIMGAEQATYRGVEDRTNFGGMSKYGKNPAENYAPQPGKHVRAANVEENGAYCERLNNIISKAVDDDKGTQKAYQC